MSEHSYKTIPAALDALEVCLCGILVDFDCLGSCTWQDSLTQTQRINQIVLFADWSVGCFWQANGHVTS